MYSDIDDDVETTCQLCFKVYKNCDHWWVHVLNDHRGPRLVDSQILYNSEDSDEDSMKDMQSNEKKFKSSCSSSSYSSYEKMHNKEHSGSYVADIHADENSSSLILPVSSNDVPPNIEHSKMTEVRKSNRSKKATSKWLMYCAEKKSGSNKEHSIHGKDVTKHHVSEDNVTELHVSEDDVTKLHVRKHNDTDNVSEGNANQYLIDALTPDIFENSKNIIEWFTQHKDLCNSLEYPLPMTLYMKIKEIHKLLIRQYCLAPPNEQNHAIYKVYKDLSNMIWKHIESINSLL